MIRMIDVSADQGADIDWVAVAAAGVRGAYIEGQVGNDGPNRLFAAQAAGARAAGIAVGVYLFAEILPDSPAHPNRDPDDQVRLLWEATGGVPCAPGDLPPMLDCEDPEVQHWAGAGVTPAFAVTWIASALAAIDARWGRTAGVYTYAPWWRALGLYGTNPVFVDRPLWLAAYPGPWDSVPPPDGTPMPELAPFGAATIWQHGSKMPLPGSGPCDGSVFAGDEDAWAALLETP